MHRPNIIAIGMLVLISIAVVATGYAKKWGPLIVLSADLSQLTKKTGQGIVGTDTLVNC